MTSAAREHRLLSVKLPVFEGPLDLLLHLIERNELDISAVSLVVVVDQYLQYLDLMRAEMKLEAAASFLVVAGRLLLIKSRSLLPRLDAPAAADDDEAEDPAEELARQLEEYRQYKLLAGQLRQLKDTRGPTFGRPAGAEEVQPVVTLTGLQLDGLVVSFRRALTRLLDAAAESAPPPGPRVTQAQRIAAIESGLSAARTLSFDALLADCTAVEDIIVTFLAVLELLKQQRIRVWQLSSFGQIVISRTAPAGVGVVRTG